MGTSRFKLKSLALLLFIGLAFLSLIPNASAQTPEEIPVVRAVLFHRNTCGHCQQLVAEILPPILDKYKNQLHIFYCDVSRPEGDALFTAAIEHYNIKIIGVPTLVVQEEVLIGSIAIQQNFPGIIDDGLSHGGLDWPGIPGLNQALAIAESIELPTATPRVEFVPFSPSPSPSSTPDIAAMPDGSQTSSDFPIIVDIERMKNNFAQDPLGNTLSVVILGGMIISVIYGIYAFLKKPGRSLTERPVWVIPLLCLIGCAIAGYLAYLEITFANAICGPVGDCQTVQQSEYARLFGILPIGLLGVAGYIAIIITWIIARTGRSRWTELASLVILGMTVLGTLFSIYLTFLEPFVIGATCMWCLSSAVLMTVLMYLSIAPGKLAFVHLFKDVL